MALLVAVLAGAGASAEEGGTPERAAFLPCAPSVEVVAGTLAGDAPSELSSWPLYEIELEVDPKARRLSGRMQVSLAAPADGLESLTLMLPPSEEQSNGSSPIEATSARVRMGTGEALAPASFEQSGLRLEVDLPRPSVHGEAVTLLVEMRGRPALRSSGTIAESIGVLSGGPVTGGNVGAIATDGVGVRLLGAHPVISPYREGRFIDDPGTAWGPPHSSVPGCFIMSVVSPSGLVSASTGRSVGAVPKPDGRLRHTFVAAGVRRMGVVLLPAETARHERRAAGVRVRASAGEASKAREMTRWAAGLLRHYETRFGAYPWERLEIVEVPMTGTLAGLRAPGMVLVNDMVTSDAGLLSSLGTPGSDSFAREVAIAHQLAHQWFGELVDTGGVASPAVEEALAWFAVLDYTRTRHGAEAADRVRGRTIDLAYHTWRMTGGPDAPAGMPLRDMLELGGLGAYLGLCDGKAPGLMEALAEAVGRKNLRRAVSGLTESRRFGHLDRGALEAAVRENAPGQHEAKVRPLFSRWLDETHGDADLGSSAEAVSRALLEELGGGPGGLDADAVEELMQSFLRSLGLSP